MKVIRGSFRVFSLIAIAGLVGATSAQAIPVQVAEAPMNDLALTVSAVNSATQSLYVNIYELSSPDIADALIARIKAGVHVEIIEEGQPVGGMSTASRGIQSEIVQAMQAAGNGDKLYEMSSKASSAKRRFRFDHAKYMVIDGQSLLIGSENYSPTGNPQPSTVGNRGWEVLISDASLTQEFRAIFTKDSDVSQGDLLDLVSSKLYGQEMAFLAVANSSKQIYSGEYINTAPTFDASTIVKFTSPDTSLSGLKNLLDQATTSIDIQQMSFDSEFKSAGGNSPLLDSVLAAAKRGVKIRVLLNDDAVFEHASHPTPSKNLATIDVLTQAGISARTANLKAMGVDYIHNKGVLVDGNKTLISSINWTENAVTHNRETAVVITSADIFNHYETLFNSDWQVSDGQLHSSVLQLAALDAQPAIAASACPDTLNVVADFQTIRASDPDALGFSELSGTKLNVAMSRSADTRGCVMVSNDDITIGSGKSTGKKLFLEIRTKADGSHTIIFEGYTSKGKLFSVRANTTRVRVTGKYTCDVYDGSGPNREDIGDAILTLAN